MKHLIITLGLAAAMLFGTVVSAHAVSEDSYTFVLPRFRGDIYSSAKSVSAYRDLGVRHKYSGGYPVAFTVCSTGKTAIGPRVVVYPGGGSAGLVDLWYNGSSSARNVIVRLESSNYNVVTVLAQGTWRWNY